MTPALTHSRTYPASASALAFPLGGIGTGNVSLGARGELRDWEIFNRPAKGNALPNTFFALWARAGEGTPVAKVLEAPLPAPHIGSHGYHPLTAAGLPRLAGAAVEHGWTALPSDRHPIAGGAEVLYLEDRDGFEVELVAPLQGRDAGG